VQEDFARSYRRLYGHHWWWRMREAIVLDHVQRLRLPAPARILDLGCGDGLLFPALERFGEVTGVETDRSLLTDGPWRDRIQTEPLVSTRYDGLQFDLILALDVLEHIEHDRKEVARLVELLAPGGSVLVTVPAGPALWDEHDRINAHWRRYTHRSLSASLSGNGARIVELRYLFHWLYPLKRVVARLNSLRQQKVEQHQLPPAWINRTMMALCSAEYRLMSGLRLPFGTSLLAILEKPSSAG
jgi:SAM-dependent methyltransferase